MLDLVALGPSVKKPFFSLLLYFTFFNGFQGRTGKTNTKHHGRAIALLSELTDHYNFFNRTSFWNLRQVHKWTAA